MASFSPPHSSRPRPVPTVLPTEQASPRPLHSQQASTISATLGPEVKGGAASPPSCLADWTLASTRWSMVRLGHLAGRLNRADQWAQPGDLPLPRLQCLLLSPRDSHSETPSLHPTAIRPPPSSVVKYCWSWPSFSASSSDCYVRLNMCPFPTFGV